MLDQRQQRTLSVIQRDKVEVIKNPCFLQLPQFRIHVSSAQDRDDFRRHLPDPLGNPERGIHRARKWNGDQHHLWLMLLQCVQSQLPQRFIQQRQRRGQGRCQRVKGWLTGCQRFGIPHKFKAGIDGFANHIGEVTKKQRAQMPRSILNTQRSKCPRQRILAVVLIAFKDIQCLKSRPFR